MSGPIFKPAVEGDVWEGAPSEAIGRIVMEYDDTAAAERRVACDRWAFHKRGAPIETFNVLGNEVRALARLAFPRGARLVPARRQGGGWWVVRKAKAPGSEP